MTENGSRDPYRHFPWTKDELEAVFGELHDETDRGRVLLSAAMLDRGLERLLRLRFKGLSHATDKEIDKVLVDLPSACLMGFAARARVAYLIGALDLETCDSLREIAKVRNAYAHKDSPPPLTMYTFDAALNALPEWWGEALLKMCEHVFACVPLEKRPSELLMCLSYTLYMAIGSAINVVATQERQVPLFPDKRYKQQLQQRIELLKAGDPNALEAPLKFATAIREVPCPSRRLEPPPPTPAPETDSSTSQ